MSGSVKLEVNGQFHDIGDCSWYQVAPCGCTCGAVVASMFEEVNATPEQAHKAMEPNGERRRIETRQGFTMQLGLRAEAVERMSGCEHDPRWGVPPIPQPEGYVWAEASAFGRSTTKTRRHLVEATAATRERRLQYPSDGDAALCGAHSRSWHEADNDLIECARCVKAAS